MTSRNADAQQRGRRGRRGRGGRGRGGPPRNDPMQKQRAFEAEQATKGPSLAELLRDELKREGGDDVGNRANAPRPQRDDRQQRGHPRDDRNRGREQRPREQRPARNDPPPNVERTGSSDRHQLDDKAELPDVSQFLKPVTPHDLDVVNDEDYDD